MPTPASDLAPYVLPPVQGEVLVATIVAGGTLDIDLTDVANRPASAAADEEWWFRRFISIAPIGGDVAVAFGIAGSAAIVPAFAGPGFSATAGVTVTATGVMAVLLGGRTDPTAADALTVLHLASVAGCRVMIWRSSPLG